MNERERLVELIETGSRLAYDKSLEEVRRIVKENHHFNSATDRTVSISEIVADYLLENGVIVPPVKVGSSDRYTICAYCDGCADVMLREGISVGDAICQLADYENTGLSPAEIKALIAEKEREDNG